MRKRGEVAKLERTPTGAINNCALANGEAMSSCQMCTAGRCPDESNFAAHEIQEREMAKKREASKKKADETSAQLDAELRKSEGLPPRRSPTDWRGPNSGPSDLTPIAPEFARITELIVIEKPLEVYRHLEKELKIGEKRSDMGTVRRALDEAESNAREAHRLWMTAMIERSRFELTNKVIFAGMRTQALAVMQQEKKHGERSKQISEADIEATCAAMFPDQWRDQELQRKRYEAMEKSMENLNDRWSSRCYTLSSLHRKQRGS